ncbi:MAG: hydroxyisourate hydrolase [Mangrovicoccus sp.]
MSGYLTTHVLDTSRGEPAAGLRVTLETLETGEILADMVTNSDGRTDSPILPASDFSIGRFQLLFYAGDYLQATGQAGEMPLFLDVIPIRFGISDPMSHYHVPLLLSPFGYSTYRGS